MPSQVAAAAVGTASPPRVGRAAPPCRPAVAPPPPPPHAAALAARLARLRSAADEAAYAALVLDVVPRGARSRASPPSAAAGRGEGHEATAAAMRLGVGVGLNVVVSMATGATVGGWLGARVVDGAGGTAAERRVGACVGALVGVVAAVFVEGTLVVVRLYAADVVEHGRGRVKA